MCYTSRGFARIEYLCDYKEGLPGYISDFMDIVYTMGNFIPLPKNRPNLFCDYWDLFMVGIYNYFYPKDAINDKENQPYKLPQIYTEWLENNYKRGWNQFVEKNFMQSFVEKKGNIEYGRPFELWDNHFGGDVLPKEKWQFEQFFVNAKVRILERGKRIAERLI